MSDHIQTNRGVYPRVHYVPLKDASTSEGPVAWAFCARRGCTLCAVVLSWQLANQDAVRASLAREHI